MLCAGVTKPANEETRQYLYISIKYPPFSYIINNLPLFTDSVSYWWQNSLWHKHFHTIDSEWGSEGSYDLYLTFSTSWKFSSCPPHHPSAEPTGPVRSHDSSHFLERISIMRVLEAAGVDSTRHSSPPLHTTAAALPQTSAAGLSYSFTGAESLCVSVGLPSPLNSQVVL